MDDRVLTPERGGRPVVFGEVLFDRFPDGSAVLGGAPFNVAWHLQAFGQEPLFISRVGDDPMGRRIRDAMTDHGMDTSGLQLDSAHPTGTVDVSFVDGEPHYDIVEDRAWDFVAADALPPLRDVALVYHGSLALRGAVTRKAFQELKQRLPAPRFVDVNLRAPWWSPATVLDLIDGAAWVKLNAGELAELDPGGDGSERAAEAWRAAHSLRLLILTRGAQGALALAPDACIGVAPEAASTVVDTVGAGDAFASVFLLGILNGWSLDNTLHRAQDFASALVGVRGATVEDPAFYAGFATAWGLGEA